MGRALLRRPLHRLAAVPLPGFAREDQLPPQRKRPRRLLSGGALTVGPGETYWNMLNTTEEITPVAMAVRITSLSTRT